MNALLEPSLHRDHPREPLYSVRAGFLVAFFGGVYATLIFSYLNTRKLGREQADSWLFIALSLIGTAAIVGLSYLALAEALPAWLSFTDNRLRDVRYISRGISLLMFGAVYLRQRRFYTAAALSGQTPPSPWQAAIAACIAGWALNFAAAMVGGMLA